VVVVLVAMRPTPDTPFARANRPGSQRLRGPIGRAICNLRPAPNDHFFETPTKHENDKNENNADRYDLPLRDRASGAHAGGHPHAGRGGEPLHMMAFLASDNDARAQETDASHDALDHAAGVSAGSPVDRQNGHSRAETQDAKRAHASRLAVQIAVEPEHDANKAGRAEPKRNVESVHDRITYHRSKVVAPLGSTMTSRQA
jgi:hypothetical protein